MKSLRVLSALVLCLSLSAAFAADVTGKWVGKVQIDESKIPAAKNAQQTELRKKMLKAIKGTTFNLDLKANKSWTMVASLIGIDKDGKPKTQQHKVDGSWKMDGKNVVMKTLHEDGNPSKNDQGEVLEPANGGKALKMLPPKRGNGPGMLSSILFTRAKG